MKPGYCYELDTMEGTPWEPKGRKPMEAPDDLWDIVVYTPKGDEVVVGQRTIDDAACVVYSCSDGNYRAQTCVAAGVRPAASGRRL